MRHLVVAMGITVLSAAAASSGGPFDGAWQGELIVRADDVRPYVCGFEKIGIRVTILNNRFVATILDPTRVERIFESDVADDGRIGAWGDWNNSSQHRPTANLSGRFLKDTFTGVGHFTRGTLGLTCAADLAMRRSPGR